MKFYTVDAFGRIYVITFLTIFTLECDTSQVHEGAAIWLFNFLCIVYRLAD